MQKVKCSKNQESTGIGRGNGIESQDQLALDAAERKNEEMEQRDAESHSDMSHHGARVLSKSPKSLFLCRVKLL